jgi:hypothetical protein
MPLALPRKGVSFQAFTHALYLRAPDPPPSSPLARVRGHIRASRMGLSNLQIPTKSVTIHFTATYAAVTLCWGNGHDEVVAIRCVGARQPPIRVVVH